MKNKTIIVTIILILIIIMSFFVFYNDKTKSDIILQEKIARDWIENNSPTYLFDGYNLTLIDSKKLDCLNCFEYTYFFLSSSAGYGDRGNSFSAQVITEHEMKIKVENNIVIEAITDDVFSEVKNEIIKDFSDEKVFVYFNKEGEEDKIFGLERIIEDKESIEKTTLELLLLGPNEYEKDMGYYTSINEGVLINGFSIDKGIAFIDFNKKLDEGVAGSARVNSIFSQIEKTLIQFKNIESIFISIDGDSEEVLQP